MLKRRDLSESDKTKISFALPEEHPLASDAYVAGSFNDWDPTADPLIRRNNQTYSAVLTLEKDEQYAYRYVTGDGQWFNVGDADHYQGANGILIT